MARSHDREVAVVERRELALAEPFGDRQHGAVDEPDFQVVVGSQQLVDASVVLGYQVLDDKGAALNLGEHRREGFVARVAAEQVVDLDQDGRGNDPGLPDLVKQLRAALVFLVVAVESGDENRGVAGQRDGSGSKTSSAASLLRSPRPELNMPMHVSGGCSPLSLDWSPLSSTARKARSACSSVQPGAWSSSCSFAVITRSVAPRLAVPQSHPR